MNNGINGIMTDQEIMNILSSPEWQEKPFSRPIVNMVENNERQTPQHFEIKVSNEIVKSIVNKDVPVIIDQTNISINKNENILKHKVSDLNSVYSVDENSLKKDDEECYLFKRSSGSTSSKELTCNKILQKTEPLTATKTNYVIFEDLISDDQKSTGEIWVDKILMRHFNFNNNSCKYCSVKLHKKKNLINK